MGTYDIQQVCLNGHQTTAHYGRSPQFRRNHCAKCGASTIHECPDCSKPIKGDYDVPGLISFGHSTAVPEFCEYCGSAFPWTAQVSAVAHAVEGGESDDALTLVEAICRRFHVVVRQLRARHDNRQTLDVEDEYDVQDLLHSLLVVFFDDVRAEEATPSYAGKSSRMDFYLQAESIVVEAKMTRKGLGAKEVADQLIVDIERYRAHAGCERLYCLVYDPEGRVANPRGVESDLSGERDGLTVDVLIVPKGY